MTLIRRSREGLGRGLGIKKIKDVLTEKILEGENLARFVGFKGLKDNMIRLKIGGHFRFWNHQSTIHPYRLLLGRAYKMGHTGAAKWMIRYGFKQSAGGPGTLFKNWKKNAKEGLGAGRLHALKALGGMLFGSGRTIFFYQFKINFKLFRTRLILCRTQLQEIFLKLIGDQCYRPLHRWKDAFLNFRKVQVIREVKKG